MPRKVKTNIYVTQKQMDALKKISSRTDIPMSVLIRRGIDAVIKSFNKK